MFLQRSRLPWPARVTPKSSSALPWASLTSPSSGSCAAVCAASSKNSSHFARGTRIDARNHNLPDDLHQVARIAEECEALARSFPLKGEPAPSQPHASATMPQHPASRGTPPASSPRLVPMPRSPRAEAPNSTAPMERALADYERRCPAAVASASLSTPTGSGLQASSAAQTRCRLLLVHRHDPLADCPRFAEAKRFDPTRHTAVLPATLRAVAPRSAGAASSWRPPTTTKLNSGATAPVYFI
ncbi:hypothetical protein Efla_006010 [Eimeria flavescens]